MPFFAQAMTLLDHQLVFKLCFLEEYQQEYDYQFLVAELTFQHENLDQSSDIC